MLIVNDKLKESTTTWFVRNRHGLENLCGRISFIPSKRLLMGIQRLSPIADVHKIKSSMQRQTFKAKLVTYVILKNLTLGAHGRFSAKR